MTPEMPDGAPKNHGPALSRYVGAALVALGGYGPERDAEQLRDLLEAALLEITPEEEQGYLEAYPGEMVGMGDVFRLKLAENLLGDNRSAADARDARRNCRRLFHLKSQAPRAWARAQHLYGLSWLHDDGGDRPAAMHKAAEAFEAELTVLKPEVSLYAWAEAVRERANLLSSNLETGDPSKNRERAIQLLQDAIDKAKGSDEIEVRARLEQSLASALSARGEDRSPQDLDQSVAHYKRALELLGERTGGDRIDVEMDLGIVLAKLAEVTGAGWQESIDYLEAALALVDRDTQATRWSRVAGNLSIVLRRAPAQRGAAGRHQRGLELLRESIKIQEAAGAWWAWAGNQNNLGNALLQMPAHDPVEAVDKAITAYRSALKVWTRTAHPKEWALTTARLGNALEERASWTGPEDLEAALRCFGDALDALDTGQDPLAWGRVANHRVGLMKTLAQSAPAPERADKLREVGEEYDRIADVIGRERAPVQWAQIRHNSGNLHRNLARMLEDSDEWRSAIDAYQDALQARPRQSAPLEWAQTMAALGEVLGWTESDEAREHSLDCLRQAQAAAIEAESPADIARISASLSSELADGERWSEAAEAGQRALEAAEVEYVAAVLRGSRELRVGQVASLARQTAYSLALAGDPAKAAATLERGRARLLAEALALDTGAGGLTGADPDANRDYLAAAESVREADAAAVRLAAEGDQAGPDSNEYRRLAEQALRARRRAATAALALAQRQTHLETADAQADVSLDRLVAYLLLADKGALILLQSAGTTEAMALADLTAGELEAALADEDDGEGGGPLDRQAQVGAAWGGEQRQAFGAMLDGALPLIGRALCGPLAAGLRKLGASAVAMIPCGRLGLLPLHAAPYERDGRTLCLIDEFTVTYGPSRAVLNVAQRTAAARAQAPNRFAAIADTRGDLPMAAVEISNLQDRAGERLTFVQGHEAIKARVMAAIGGATNIHFACHGQTFADRPLESHLVLAGDERLTLADLLSTPGAGAAGPLGQARLVVASACQTAVIDGTRLPDEVLGLPSGFLQAGTPCFIGTLWPVADLSSALLMTHFYELHCPDPGAAALPADQALCHAAVWLRDLDGRSLDAYLARHPKLAAKAVAARALARRYPDRRAFDAFLFWAPYVCMGAAGVPASRPV